MIHRMKAVQKLHPLVTWKFEKGAPCKPGETAKSSGCIPASGEVKKKEYKPIGQPKIKPLPKWRWYTLESGEKVRLDNFNRRVDAEGNRIIPRYGDDGSWSNDRKAELEELKTVELRDTIAGLPGPAAELSEEDRVTRQMALQLYSEKVGNDTAIDLLDEIDPPAEVEGPEGLGDVRFPGPGETRWGERRLALTPKVDPEVWGRLSEDQVKSIRMYTGHGGEASGVMRDINGRLRGLESRDLVEKPGIWRGNQSWEEWRDKRSKNVDNYTKGINESIDQVGKFEKPVTTYRGMGSGNTPAAKKLLKDLKALNPGDKFSLGGFQSTSLNPAVLYQNQWDEETETEGFFGKEYSSGGVGLEIITEHGIPVLNKSGYAGEQEILLGHDWEYEVKGLVDNPNAGQTKDGKLFDRHKLGVTDLGMHWAMFPESPSKDFRMLQVIARPKKKEGTV